MKSNSVMTHVIRSDGVHVWTYSDGKTLEFNPAKAPGPMLLNAADHGWNAKIGDAAAIARDPDTGKSATVAEKREAMQRVVDSLYAGNWNAGRESTGGDLAEAIATVRKQSRDKVATWLKTQDAAAKTALRNVKAIKKELDKIAEARGKAAGLDGDAILATMPD